MKRKTTPQQTADNALDAALACDDSILVGIDWADKAHEYHLVTPDGQVKHGEFKQAPESIAHWIASLKQQHPDAQIEICIETSRGALINGLLEHDVKLFPINPNALRINVLLSRVFLLDARGLRGIHINENPRLST